MAKASMVEGKGPFICTNESHKDEFKTNDLEKFNEHLAEEGHTFYGTMPCAICGEPITIPQDKPTPVGKTHMHKTCRNESEGY